jgi:hypothetical protein
MIPGAKYPKSVYSFGGRVGYEDQGQTPNTQIAIMDFDDTKLVFEVRGLKTEPFHGEMVGNILHFTDGTVASGKFYRNGSQEGEALPASKAERGPGANHFANFIEAVRSRKVEDLNADVLEGHYSSALCHLANISYRLGHSMRFPFSRQHSHSAEIVDMATVETIERLVIHLHDTKVLSLTEPLFRDGRSLNFNADEERFTDDEEANALLRSAGRGDFSVPENVG